MDRDQKSSPSLCFNLQMSSRARARPSQSQELKLKLGLLCKRQEPKRVAASPAAPRVHSGRTLDSGAELEPGPRHSDPGYRGPRPAVLVSQMTTPKDKMQTITGGSHKHVATGQRRPPTPIR